MDYEEKVLEYTESFLTIDFTTDYDMDIGTEDTADRYTLYYIKTGKNPLDIQENVYYDEDNFKEALKELIKENWGITIFISDDPVLDLIEWEDIYDTLGIKD